MIEYWVGLVNVTAMLLSVTPFLETVTSTTVPSGIWAWFCLSADAVKSTISNSTL